MKGKAMGSIECLDRFWAKVNTQSDNGCWEWKEGVDEWGYGYFYVNSSPSVRAHRFAYEIMTGERIPAGMIACHKCDNPKCVNPSHIFIGTDRDNSLDMVAKGRHWAHRVTHCVRGHEKTPENSMYVKGLRRCKACHRIHTREGNRRAAARKKEQAA